MAYIPVQKYTGIYIIQNTVARRRWEWGKKIKNQELGKKMKKGKENMRKIT